MTEGIIETKEAGERLHYPETFKEITREEVDQWVEEGRPDNYLTQVRDKGKNLCYQETVPPEPEGTVYSRYLSEIGKRVEGALEENGTVVLVGPPSSAKKTLFEGSPTMSPEDIVGDGKPLVIDCAGEFSGSMSSIDVRHTFNSIFKESGVSSKGIIVLGQFDPAKREHKLILRRAQKSDRKVVCVFTGELSNKAKREEIQRRRWLADVPVLEMTHQRLNQTQALATLGSRFPTTWNVETVEVGDSEVTTIGNGLRLSEIKEGRFSEEKRGGLREKLYETIPVMLPDDLPEQCGFLSSEDYREEFRRHLLGILQDSKAIQAGLADLLIKKLFAEDAKTDILRLRELDGMSDEELGKVADNFSKKDKRVGLTYIARHWIWMETLFSLSQQYPNLTLFRGAEFSEETGFNGFDFSMLFNESIKYCEKDVLGHERAMPVMVMASLKSVLEGCEERELQASSELDYDRSTLEVERGILKMVTGRNLAEIMKPTILRVPSTEEKEERDALLDSYRQKAIKVE